MEVLQDSGRETRCGIACFAPRWMGRMATAKTFLVVYGFLGTLQAMAYIYFVATLTTIEKRFKIPSQTTGLMMSGNEVSQIMLSLLLTYLGGRGNRPRWIAWGVAISAASCLILALPHFVYGPGRDALMLTKEYASSAAVSQATAANGSAAIALLRSRSPTGEKHGLCSDDGASPLQEAPPDGCEVDGDLSAMPLALVFLSQFVLGIGTTLYFALGQTYLDDNTVKRKTPMLLGVVLALRTVGPALGFLLGWACLSIYIDPSLTPIITKKDPRWLGAWWLGWIILTVAMLLFSLLIAMFPRHLPKKKAKLEKEKLPDIAEGLQPLRDKKSEEGLDGAGSREEEEWVLEERNVPKLKDFPAALARLLRNRILMVNNFAGVFYILGASGYITFTTKYMETQFHQSAAGANIIAGTAGILAMVGGFLVSGIMITKFRPRPRLLLGWNVLVGMAYVVGELSFISLGCSSRPLHGAADDGSLQLNWDCNAGCGCERYLKYSPVCSADGKLTYYSACHAGCKSMAEEMVSGAAGGILSPGSTITRRYDNCSCISLKYEEEDWSKNLLFSGFDTPNILGPNGASEGPCAAPDCARPFLAFLVISCFMHFLGSSGKVGNILVNYRSVKPEDKAFAQGLSLLLVSLLAFIPGQILYGAIIDNVCLVWDKSCGRRGNCWLYHKEYFRFYLNSTAAFFTIIAVILDGVVCYLGKDLELYKESDGEEDNRTLSKTRNKTEDSIISDDMLKISEK